MKRQLMTAAMIVVAGTALTACNKDKKPDSVEARAAYSIGFMTGKNLQTQVPSLDTGSFDAGFKDAYAKKESVLTQDEMKAALTAFEQKVRADMEAAHKKDATEASIKGKAFLEANAKKPGVKVTASGLQYEVITEGKGAKPKASDKVKVDYEGKLTDGTVFDSSIARHEPVTFPLAGVIPGWTEGLQLMTVGSKYRFVIPANLAYGEQGAGPIPPNSVLVFEVQLLEILP